MLGLEYRTSLVSVSSYQSGSIRGFLHQPGPPPVSGLVLAHGAGTNSQSALLVAVANAFCEFGVLVLRCDLPFRQKRRFGPPSPANAPGDRAGLREAVLAVREMSSRGVYLGGHSYGGRQSSILASEEPQLADGVLLLSYPLHPPARPDQLRTAHWPTLQTPSFFVQGTKDPFGSVAEMQSALPLVAAPTQLVTIEGAGHELARGQFEIQTLVVHPFQALALSPRNPHL